MVPWDGSQLTTSFLLWAPVCFVPSLDADPQSGGPPSDPESQEMSYLKPPQYHFLPRALFKTAAEHGLWVECVACSEKVIGGIFLWTSLRCVKHCFLLMGGKKAGIWAFQGLKSEWEEEEKKQFQRQGRALDTGTPAGTLPMVPAFQLLSTIIFTGCLPPSFTPQSILLFCLYSPCAHPAAPYCCLR